VAPRRPAWLRLTLRALLCGSLAPRAQKFRPQIAAARHRARFNARARSLLIPSPAGAVVCLQAPSPNPINTNTVGADQPIICVNTDPRTNPAGNAVNLTTNGAGSYIDLNNSGVLNATNNNFFMSGIFAYTRGRDSPIAIDNAAAITAINNGPGNAFAIRAKAYRGDSPITIENSGELRAYSVEAAAAGIYAFTAAVLGPGTNPISIVNSGNITVSGFSGAGINAFAVGSNSPINIENSGDIVATGDQFAGGILAEINGPGSSITVENPGDIFARANSSFSGRARGIYVDSDFVAGPINVVNNGNITVIGNHEYVTGISIEASDDSPVSLVNSGDIAASGGEDNFAILISVATNSPLSIENSGDIASATSVGRAYGLFVVGESALRVKTAATLPSRPQLRMPRSSIPMPSALAPLRLSQTLLRSASRTAATSTRPPIMP
jgi:hypothetical protein